MTSSNNRAMLRRDRQKYNKSILTPAQKKEVEQANQFVIFGGRQGNKQGSGRSFEDFQKKAPALEPALSGKKIAANADALLNAQLTHNLRQKAPYVRQPGREKKARSKAEHERRKVAAIEKRERKQAKRRSAL